MTREQYRAKGQNLNAIKQAREKSKKHGTYKKGDRKMSNTNLFIYHEGKSIDLCKFEICS